MKTYGSPADLARTQRCISQRNLEEIVEAGKHYEAGPAPFKNLSSGSLTSRPSPTKPARLPDAKTERLSIPSASQTSVLAFKTVASCYLFQNNGGTSS